MSAVCDEPLTEPFRRPDTEPGGGASPPAAPAEYAISARGLTRSFGDRRALDGIDLHVPAGSVLGLLGPNGSGKTTTVRVLSTLLKADGGRATVAGHDVAAEPESVRRSIGLSGQYAAVDERLTARENLYLVSRLYGMSRRTSRRHTADLLDRFRLTEAADRPSGGFSGGMRRRLDLAGALASRPPVVFLDEPTTGLDPRGRNDTWQAVKELVADGTTVLLTTQYLEEADQLADAITVIDQGRVIARGTAAELKSAIGGERITLTVPEAAEHERARSLLDSLGPHSAELDARTGVLRVATDHGTHSLQQALGALEGEGIEVRDVALAPPALDDVFLSLTNRPADPTTGTEPAVGGAADGCVPDTAGRPRKRSRLPFGRSGGAHAWRP